MKDILTNIEYRDLFWLLLGSVMGRHVVKAIDHVVVSYIPGL